MVVVICHDAEVVLFMHCRQEMKQLASALDEEKKIRVTLQVRLIIDWWVEFLLVRVLLIYLLCSTQFDHKRAKCTATSV